MRQEKKFRERYWNLLKGRRKGKKQKLRKKEDGRGEREMGRSEKGTEKK